MKNSLFRLVSVGTVVENKVRGSNDIEVYLIEHSPFVNGDLKSDTTTDTYTGVDAAGKQYAGNVQLSNSVVATWRGSDGNRVTAPDVRRGDEVDVWQYADVDKYYWSARTDTSNTAKKLETVVHAFSGTTDETATELTEENSYSAQVSTHDGHMTIKTSKANGEPFAYTAQIDTKNGNFVIADDAGLYIQGNSADRHVEVVNGGGCSVDLKEDAAKFKCATLEVDASTSVNFNTPLFTVNQKDFVVTGGKATMGGSLTVLGDTTLSTNVTSGGTNISGSHRHSGIKGGTEDSGLPH